MFTEKLLTFGKIIKQFLLFTPYIAYCLYPIEKSTSAMANTKKAKTCI